MSSEPRSASDILAEVLQDARYVAALDWGVPRRGHPEGTIRAHIDELEANLERLQPLLTPEEAARVRLLIHVHDTFKPQATPGVAILHPESHASLARTFLAEFGADAQLLAMTQLHDESYALWRQMQYRGACDPARFQRLLDSITDWNVCLAFCIADGCTAGKGREKLEWFFAELAGKVDARISAADIIRADPAAWLRVSGPSPEIP